MPIISMLRRPAPQDAASIRGAHRSGPGPAPGAPVASGSARSNPSQPVNQISLADRPGPRPGPATTDSRPAGGSTLSIWIRISTSPICTPAAADIGQLADVFTPGAYRCWHLQARRHDKERGQP